MATNNTCWMGGRAIEDNFRRAHRMRAQDMDGFAKNFIEITRHLNDRIVPLLTKLAKKVDDDGEFDEEIDALKTKLNVCLRRQYVDPDADIISNDLPIQYDFISDALAAKLEQLVKGPVERRPGVDAAVYNDRLRR